MYVGGQMFMLENVVFNKHAALSIPQRSEHVCGVTAYGRHPHSQRKRYAGCCCMFTDPMIPDFR